MAIVIVNASGENARRGSIQNTMSLATGLDREDICKAIRTHFEVEATDRLILIDEDECDVPIDTSLTEGNYVLVTTPDPSSDNSLGDLDQYVMMRGRQRTRATTARPSLTATSKRFKILSEIWTTEKAYMEGLTFLKEMYVDPMNQPKLERSPLIKHRLKGGDLHKLFPKALDEIINLTKLIWGDLDTRIGTAASTGGCEDEELCVSDIFIKYEPFLKMYTNYAVQYESACQFLSDLRATNHTGINTYEAKVMKDFAGDSVKGRPLDSLLILPVQRVLRYKMLLDALVKATDEDSRTFADLKKANRVCADIAMLVNDKKAEAERRNLVYQKQVELKVDNLLSRNREYAYEDDIIRVTKLHKKGKKEVFEEKVMKGYMFNDLFFFGKLIGTAFTQLGPKLTITRTCQFSVSDVDQLEYVQKLQESEKAKSPSRRKSRFASLKKFSFSSKSSDHPPQFAKALEECYKMKKNQKPKGAHATQAYVVMLVYDSGLPVTPQGSQFKREASGKGGGGEGANEVWAVRYIVLDEEAATLFIYDRHDSSAANKLDVCGSVRIMTGPQDGYGPGKIPNVVMVSVGNDDGSSSGVVMSVGAEHDEVSRQFQIWFTGQVHMTNPNPNDVVVEHTTNEVASSEEHHVVKLTYGEKKTDAKTTHQYYIELADKAKKDKLFQHFHTMVQYKAHLNTNKEASQFDY